MYEVRVAPPQSLADQHTLIAQRYAGYFPGHPFRQVQMTQIIDMDTRRKWREPQVVADDCIFCQRMTDEDVVRRMEGYQHQIDIECTRGRVGLFNLWALKKYGREEDSPKPGFAPRPGLAWPSTPERLRAFVEDTGSSWGDEPSKPRPMPMVDLPLRLKRKLCIEWNHLYLDWMEKENVKYDFDSRMFFRESEQPAPPEQSDDSWPYAAMVMGVHPHIIELMHRNLQESRRAIGEPEV